MTETWYAIGALLVITGLFGLMYAVVRSAEDYRGQR